ncbi:monovalent cation/H(+) antiporter subunit G [Nesterenkonia aerolata]|uniref:Monovalent cation/H(+) antiporter subunit G n=1 Tax=Nesterenkonia aerolata TaxID=3074079 RepID=A0ABU2DRB3_9MICC|nr:monovalent cation/H(+) antiporter subunit G [Nesterenkonia sp. LY-0111]MDR8019042.1 monovalent cation/H(+) antiporter subunit G [Nesterenkonia sp. LY-0111]
MLAVDAELIREIIVAVLLLVGGLMSLAAGVGLLRFPDLHSRMHAATKPQVLGLLALVLACAVTWDSWPWVGIVIFAWMLQLLTAPVSAHMVGRAGYRTKHFKPERLTEDELAAAVDRINRSDSSRKAADDRRAIDGPRA